MTMKFKLMLILVIISVSIQGIASNTLSINEFIKQVQVQSPDLQIDQALSDEATAKASGSQISPPMVGLMTMKDGSGRNQGIEVEQQIPFPTKIGKEIDTRRFDSEAQKSSQAFRKFLIISKARMAYFEYWAAFEKLQLAKEKKNWLKQHAKIARTTTRSDSGAQIHLLGIESEVDLFENEVITADTNFSDKKILLKTYVPDLNLTDLVPKKPELEKVQVDPVFKNTLIRWKENELKAAEANQSLMNQAYLPDIILRYRGFNGNELTPRSEELMVGITLPFLFFWQAKSETRQASFRSTKTQSELRKAQIESEATVKSLTLKIENLSQQLSNLEVKILPRAQKRMNLIKNLSQRTMEGLDEHRQVMLDTIDLKTKTIDLRVELENSNSDLMALIGKEGNL